ncbi:MAG: hypothetical protein Q9187_000143 [Circinaria calcarea]
MALSSILKSRVKARKDDTTDLDEEVYSTLSVSAARGGSSSGASDNTGSGDKDEIDSGQDQDDDSDVRAVAVAISFGALAAAQNSVFLKRKRASPRPEQPTPNDCFPEADERRAGKKDHRTHSRQSRHAPAEFSSKKAVSRKREVIPIRRVSYRDPRFEPLSGPLVPEKIKRNYSFLDSYRTSEIASLKTTLHNTKDPSARESLRKTLLSMESQEKARAAKEAQQEIIREHRKKEKEAIEKGKQPFYLKKGEQKKLALVKRFEGLGDKKAERVIERRRRKKAGRERKGMPFERRIGEVA